VILDELMRFVGREVPHPFRLIPLKGDGSDRSYFRVLHRGGTAVVLDHHVNPKEAEAFFHIGIFLGDHGIPVPKILAYERERFFLLEDLGSQDLFGERKQVPESLLIDRYQQAIDVLIRLQTCDREQFDTDWCSDDPVYNGRFAYTRESCYFIECFVRGVLEYKHSVQTLHSELRRISMAIDDIKTTCLMHRDYQSRNIMIHNGLIRVIDFQGTRLGPPQYDVASLLYDPYTALSANVRSRLLECYVSQTRVTSRDAFFKDLALVAFHRLLQTLGAFGNLGYRKRKPGFRPFVPSAVTLLLEVWKRLDYVGYPSLRSLMEWMAEQTIPDIED